MQQIGRYQILGELGRGAMGVVYRAQDPAIGRTIAIKTIRLTDLTDASERERLRERLFREAQTAGILSHPNIVTIYDILEEGGLAYIFMEFVNGPALEKLLSAKEPPDKRMFFGTLRQTAAALDYAHRKGIIHRDIKPSNIMIHDDGTAKITDFGVAKIVSQQMTQSGTMMGTPTYMSPEQVQGTEVTGRTDQFALAVIAYEMLTGDRPFVADYLPSLLYKICRDDPVPAQRLNPTLAPEVDTVLRRGLAKESKDRFSTCTEFVDELHQACNLRSDWTVLARGTSLNLPTVSMPRTGVPEQSPPVNAADETVAAPTPVPVAVAPAPMAERPTRFRERERLEQPESHTVRNVVLALASVVVIGLIVLAAQEQNWFGPKPTTPVAETVPAVPEPSKPSPTPATPTPSTPAPSTPAQPTEPTPQEEAPAAKKTPIERAARTPAQRPSMPQRTPQGVDVISQFMTSPPGATVLVDGNSQLSCRAPCSLTLGPGRHTLLARAEGYRDANRIFEIPRDAHLNVDMERNGGTLSISSNMTGSLIFINGQERAERTPAIISLPIGTYQVRLVNGRFQCETDPVRIQDGSIARRTCDMQ